MLRRRVIIYTALGLLTLAGAGLFFYLRSGHLESLLRRRLTETMTDILGRQVSLSELSIRYFPLEGTAEGIHVEPWLDVERVEASLSFSDLLRGRITVTDIDIYRPVFRWQVDDGPLTKKREPGEKKGDWVSLQRLRVHDGMVHVGSVVHRIDMDVEGIRLQAIEQDSSSLGPWAGSAVFSKGRFAFDDLVIDGLSGMATLEADAQSTTIHRLRVTTAGADVRGEGSFTRASSLTGGVDLRASIQPGNPQLAWPWPQIDVQEIDLDVRLETGDDGFHISGEFSAESPRFDPDRDSNRDGPMRAWPAGRTTGTLDVKGGRVDVTASVADIAGGSLNITYVRTPGEARGQEDHHLTATARGLEPRSLLDQLEVPGKSRVSPSATLSGKASLSWKGNAIREAKGQADLLLTPTRGKDPLKGTAAVTWSGGRFRVESADLEISQSTIRFAGVIDATRQPARLDLKGDFVTQSATPVASFIERRFGPGGVNPADERPPFRLSDIEGHLEARVSITGDITQPDVTARLASDNLFVSLPRFGGASKEDRVDIPLNLMEMDVGFGSSRLRLDLISLTGEDLEVEGLVEYDLQEGAFLQCNLEASRISSELLYRLFSGADTPVTGMARARVDLESSILGSYRWDETLEGTIVVEAEELELGDLTATSFNARARLYEGSLEVESVALNLLNGRIAAEGNITLGSGLSGGEIRVMADALDLSALPESLTGQPLRGQIDTDTRLTLLGNGTVEGNLSASGLAVGQIALGSLTGPVRGTFEKIQVELLHTSPDRGASATFYLTDPRGLVVDAEVRAGGFSLEEVRPILPPGSLPGLRGDADGRITVRGPLLDPAQLEMFAVLSRIQLEAGDYPMRNQDPVRLTFQDNFLTLAPLRLIGEKTDLLIGGSMVVGGQYEVTARISGNYDLGLLEVLLPEARASGKGTADLRVIEKGDVLTYSGLVTIEDGILAHPAIPMPLKEIRGVGRFTEEGRLEVDQITCEMGGGKIEGSGYALFVGASVPEAVLDLKGAGIRAEILPGLKAFFDADTTFTKSAGAYRFGGDVRIHRAIYTDTLGPEPAKLVLRNREFGPARTRARETVPINLDIDISAERDLWIRNEEALIEASAALNLGGTIAEPELTGNISALEGGTYRFRGVSYRIARGSIILDEVDRIDPTLDMEASTRVSNYEVILRISGKMSAPEYDLTSDPALDEADIVWLLLTGQTLSDNPQASTQFTEAQVTAYLASPLTGAATAPLAQLPGITSVRIDPYYLEGTADPSARMTVTSQLSHKLLFTYSMSFDQIGEEVYQVEYNTGRLWDFIATRDEDGSLGGDIRFRRRWRGRNPFSTDTDPPTEPAGSLKTGQILFDIDTQIGSERKLRGRVPLKEGRLLRRGDLLEGRENLRLYYIKNGFPAVDVDVEELAGDPSAPLTRDIKYTIRSGPLHQIRITGDVGKHGIRKAIRKTWSEPILIEDLAQEARGATLDYLHEKGRYNAKVEASIEAMPDDERRVNIDAEPGPQVRVSEIVIRGNDSIPMKRIRKQMLTTDSGFWSFFNKGNVNARVLDEDVDSIQALYQAHGYLGASVSSPEITVSEAGDSARVEVVIDEGPQWKVGSVEFEGTIIPQMDQADLRKAAALETGSTVTWDALTEASNRVRQAIDSQGYPKVRVRATLEGLPEASEVVISLTPGERAIVRNITVTGNTRTRSRIIDRNITMEHGEPLSRAEILATQRNLYRLGVFQSVKIKQEPVEEGSDLVDVTVQVEEGTPILTGWGVGYDTVDRLRGTLEMSHNNLFGTGRSAATFIRASSVNRRIQFTFRDKNLFGEKIETLGSIFGERTAQESFDERRIAASVQLSRKINKELTLYGNYRLENVDLTNLQISAAAAGLQDVQLGSFALSATHDRRDNILNPSRGTMSSLEFRIYAPMFGSEETFNRIYGTFAFFKNVGKGVIWASSIRSGYLTDLPSASERFYAGGDTTLRGFKRDEVGPKDPTTGNPVGGRTLFIFNQEMRFPIYKAVRGVAFYDSGNVWLAPHDFEFSDIRHVAGIGLRLTTPVGPFRIEYGWKLDREAGESPGELFFSIGQAF